MIDLLRDDARISRASAAVALGEIGPAAKAAVPALTELLRDKDLSVWANAAQALAKIGPDVETAVPILKELLGDEVLGRSGNDCGRTGRFWPSSEGGDPALKDLLKDEKKTVRSHAAWALWEVNGIETEEAILDLTSCSRTKTLTFGSPLLCN